MNRWVSVTSVLIALAAGPACALTVTVDWTGAGDYLTLPEAVAQAGPADTVLIAPGVYALGGVGWPIVLNAMSPTIVGRDGAEVTVLEGTGTETAFKINATVRTARRHLRGLTFRNLAHLIYKPSRYEGGPLIFTDNVVEYCTGGLDASTCWASGLVARNIIRYSGSMSLYANSGIVEYNEISHCSGGMVMYYSELPTIRYNYIHHSGTGIVTGSSCDIQNNVIEDNATRGILLDRGGLVQGNIIRRNGTGIRVAGSSPIAQICYNDIYDNGCNLRADSPLETDPPWQMIVGPNWWGTTDPVQIAAAICDCHDSIYYYVCVVFEPWCTAPGCGASGLEPFSWGAIKAMFR